MRACSLRFGVVLLALASLSLHAQEAVPNGSPDKPLPITGNQNGVFVVGMDTATSDMIRPFKSTRVELPNEMLDQRGREGLMRGLIAELGFATRAIPIGPPGILLYANGRMEPGNLELRTRLYKRGVSVDAGERFQVTKLSFSPNSIILDLNGGPYEKHRWLKHIEINGMQMAPQNQDPVVGSRIILQFEGPIPNLTSAEVKLLLEPVLDFGNKTSSEAYAETLPEPLKLAIEQHQVLVGMSRRMVLASAGQPVMKVREHPNGGTDGEVLEEWIYGKSPEPTRFVRFRGDRVVLLKIAAIGKPIEVHEKDEMAGYLAPADERILHMGDVAPGAEDGQGARPPSLNTQPAPASTPTSAAGQASNQAPTHSADSKHLM